MAYYDFLNIIFAPLLRLPTALAVIIISFIVSLLVVVISKYMTDQALMKKIKEDIKENQKQAKESKNNPGKLMEIQKKQMALTMQQFQHTLKPTLITFIPIIFIFGWMNATFAYEGISPQQEFGVTAFFDKNANGNVELVAQEGISLMANKTQKIENGKASWNINGVEGEHLLEFVHGSEKQQKNVLITTNNKYIEPIKKIKNGAFKAIQINYRKLVVIPIGFRDWLGWLGTYIWSSIILTMVLRKVMKVY